MIKVHCHTNLDDLKREAWPTELPDRPLVGDIIESGTTHGDKFGGFRFELKVVRVIWKVRNPMRGVNEWYCDVELHLVSGSISEFQERYHRITRG